MAREPKPDQGACGQKVEFLSFKNNLQDMCLWMKRPISYLNVQGLWGVFKTQFLKMIIVVTLWKGRRGGRCFLCSRGTRADNRSTSGSSLFKRLLLAKLHHGNCLLFTLIYLDCDNRGLTDSQGYDVIEDLGIDFWFTSARPVCFWMRHTGVDLKNYWIWVS